MIFKIENLKNKFYQIWKIGKNIFSDYAEHSTIHGVSYIIETGRSWLERAWWLFVLCFSTFCCGQLLIDAWNINPLIITFTSKPTPIWQLPFPAVTVCSKTLYQYKHINLDYVLYHFYQNHTVTEDEKQKMIAISRFCMKPILPDYENTTNCNDCLKILRQIKIPLEELIVECKFNNRLINCSESFQETVMGFAICYTFNGIDLLRHKDNQSSVASAWNIDDGYSPDASLDTYPRRAMGAGKNFGLSLVLKTDMIDVDYTCGSSGFNVESRLPHERPQFITRYHNIRFDESVTFMMKPKIMMTAKNLRHYPANVRNCYFSDEKRLKYFTHYTIGNCEAECELDIVQHYCNCLGITIEDRGDVEACGRKHVKCIDSHQQELFFHNFSTCHCLPDCSSIIFESETFVTNFNVTTMSTLTERQKQQSKYSQISIFFKESQFMVSERQELYGTTDFLANCGGLMGLCLGVSVISLFEIVYFCTIRLYDHLKRSEDQIQNLFLKEFQHIRKRSSRKFSKVFKDLLNDYSNKTTIQGINYVADTSLTFMERIWWAIVVVMAAVCCGLLIYIVFDRFEQSPIIISYGNEETPVSKVPFPAITVCPQVVSVAIKYAYKRIKVDNFSIYELPPNTLNYITAIAQVCDPEVFGDIDPLNKTNCNECQKDLGMMMGGVDNILINCQHSLGYERCSNLFEKVITEEGVCFTFNGLEVYRDGTNNDTSIEKWTLEDGYSTNASGADNYPRTGSRYQLFAFLAGLKEAIDGVCKGPIQGFKAYLHLPNEVPQVSKHYYLLPFQQVVKIIVTPKMITTAPELRDFSAEKRQCYFKNERHLQFFKYYTQNNCEIECLTNLTLKECGCLRFHMPPILPGVKLCGIGEIQCHQSVIQKNIIQTQTSVCNCLPSCTSISYDAEINQYEMELASEGYYNYPKEYSVGEISVIFKEFQFIALERSQLYGTTEILANCGGLLGLFLGFSVVSILELMYFCTLRLFCNIRLHFQGIN